MAEAKTKATKASVSGFLAKVQDAKRRADCHEIVKLMKDATGEPAVMWGPSIVGFGRYKLQYASGREAEWPVVAFSPRKNDLTLYLHGLKRCTDLLGSLGKHKKGGSCLYLKSLADVDQSVLKQLIEKSVKAIAAKRVE